MPKFFDLKKPKQFKYEPRYYSEEKERIDNLKRRIDEAPEDFERHERMKVEFAAQRPNTLRRKGLLTGRRLIIFIVVVILLLLWIMK